MFAQDGRLGCPLCLFERAGLCARLGTPPETGDVCVVHGLWAILRTNNRTRPGSQGCSIVAFCQCRGVWCMQRGSFAIVPTLLNEHRTMSESIIKPAVRQPLHLPAPPSLDKNPSRGVVSHLIPAWPKVSRDREESSGALECAANRWGYMGHAPSPKSLCKIPRQW